jgi:hypothetical protein
MREWKKNQANDWRQENVFSLNLSYKDVVSLNIGLAFHEGTSFHLLNMTFIHVVFISTNSAQYVLF